MSRFSQYHPFICLTSVTSETSIKTKYIQHCRGFSLWEQCMHHCKSVGLLTLTQQICHTSISTIYRTKSDPLTNICRPPMSSYLERYVHIACEMAITNMKLRYICVKQKLNFNTAFLPKEPWFSHFKFQTRFSAILIPNFPLGQQLVSIGLKRQRIETTFWIIWATIHFSFTYLCRIAFWSHFSFSLCICRPK